MIIAGDIGGTKTNIALFALDDVHFANPLQLTKFRSHDYNSLEAIVEDYLKTVDKGVRIVGGCFAIAGPVVDNVCKTTNLPWIVDAKKLASILHLPPLFLVNDLLANAFSIELIPANALETLQQPNKQLEGNCAMVSPGTGLGEAGLYWDGSRHHPFACEGGHTDFAPVDDLQIEVYHYLKSKFGHVSYERLLSGPGFVNIFDFFVESRKMPVPAWLQEELQGKDHAVIVTQNALNGKSDLCMQTLDLFVRILGQECGNAALKFMAFGGLYIGGGIAPKILSKLKEKEFLEGFLNKGRFDDLLEQIPIYVILDDKASLKGAALFAKRRLDDSRPTKQPASLGAKST